MNTLRQQLGNAGEREAETFLIKRQFKLVERNYRCRGGEIDLVMTDPNPTDAEEVLVFVEVRLRGRGAQVSALDSIDAGKRSRLIMAARHFLMSKPEWQEHPCRFDVIAMDTSNDRLIWVPNAFEIDS
ncbi:MAG: YraN family protein [Wenzhouxiangella sp.]|nr:MAG: YraN family protein [Wenzhouxiangella sp.]